MNLVYFFFIFFCVFYEEIQDSRQKWQENNFCKKSAVDSADTLRVKNFVEIALSRPVSEINTYLCLTQKNQDGRQKWWENIFFEKQCQ